MSACIKWAKERLDEFNGTLGKQLGSVRWGSETWVDCVERAKGFAGGLGEVGVDFEGLVGVGIGEGRGGDEGGEEGGGGVLSEERG